MLSETYQAEMYGWHRFNDQEWLSYFPSVLNTGVPEGTNLTRYLGHHFITEDMVIEDQIIEEDLLIAVAGELVIRRCHVISAIDVSATATLLIEDSLIDAGHRSNPAIGYQNLTVRRCDIRGGQHSVLGGDNVLIEDSYLHAQYNDPNATASKAYHNNSFLSNGGSHIQLLRNTLECRTGLTEYGGGATGTASIFGDFAVMDDVLFEENLIKWTDGSYGLSCGWNKSKNFGDNPTNIVVRRNAFERGPTGMCGSFGSNTSLKTSEPTNEWEDNYWLDDLTPVYVDDTP